MRGWKGWLALALLALSGFVGWWRLQHPSAVAVTVVRGDTLGRIAKQYGVSVADLMAWNGLSSDHIQVGQVLQVHVGPTAPAAAPSPARARRSGSQVTGIADTVAGSGGLTLPPEQPCLVGPHLEADDGSLEMQVAASQGLSLAQLRQGVQSVMTPLLACIPAGSAPQGVLDLEITVVCTGRVAQVRVMDGGGLDPALVACALDTLRYAAFPAHDLPDGEVFRYPLTFGG